MTGKNLLREVRPEDEELILAWANDPEVRNSSFNSQTISPAQHQKWFGAKLVSPNVQMFILENERKPAGLIRFEKNAEHIGVSYLIAPEARGKGLSSTMLGMGIVEKRKIWGKTLVLASIIEGNIISRKALIAAGFASVLQSEDREVFAKR